MAKRDEVDRQLARQYAWTLEVPSGPIQIEEPRGHARSDEDDGDGAPDGDGDLGSWRERSMAACEALAAAVERVWALVEPRQPRQPQEPRDAPDLRAGEQAALPLLEHASTLGFALTGLVRYPRQAVRLVRLLHRYRASLPEETRDSLAAATLWLRFEHPETAELLIEVAAAGDSWLASRLALPLSSLRREHGGRPFADYPDFVPRLVAILSAGPSWSSREIALGWLELSCSAAAIPALRRSLRLPHIGVRGRALDLLLDKFQPPAVEEEDVQFLLADLFPHPPPPSRALSEPLQLYAQALLRAVAVSRPPGGDELLLRMVRGEGVPRQLASGDFDRHWALRVLAAAYPERALPHVDHFLGADSWARYAAVRAAEKLPDELARPRLLRGAGDGAPFVAESARDLWLERFGSPCPVEPLAGVETSLLTGPPSERMASRLLVLRGRSAAARQAMLEVLLDEAPDAEALALITFALADDTLLYDRHRRRLPRDLEQLVARLYRRFGSEALRALGLVAGRYPGVCAIAWLRRLHGLASAKKLRKRDYPLLRELAAGQLDSAVPYGPLAALSLMSSIGAPARLRPRLLELLLAGADGWAWATDILAKWPADAELDAELFGAASVAWRAGDLTRAARVCHAGFKRGIPALRELAAEALGAWLTVETDGRWADAGELGTRQTALLFALSCLDYLLGTGSLPGTWITEALRDPASPAFVLAARQLRKEHVQDALPALLDALDSSARGYESAAEAATTLVRLDALPPDDPRLVPLVGRAPREQRLFLLFLLVYLKAPLAPLRPLIAELFTSTSARELKDLARYVPTLSDALDPTAVAELLPQIRDPELREQIALHLTRKDPPPAYWQDPP